MGLERHGDLLEDTHWIHPTNDDQHINLAELNATLKSLNLSLQWQSKLVHIYTDSVCVQYLLTETLMSKSQVRMKALSEMLT